MIAGSTNTGVLVKAISPSILGNYKIINENINTVRNNPLDCDCILIGDTLATKLGLEIGSLVTLYSTQTISTPFGSLPKTKDLIISGIFHSGMSEYDSNFTLISLKNGQSLTNNGDKVTTIEIHLSNPNNIDETKLRLSQQFSSTNYLVRDWKEVNSTFFEALKVERIVMFIILSLIILIAALSFLSKVFNSSPMRLTKEIAIMRTIGLSRMGIMRIFLLIGSVVGISGNLQVQLPIIIYLPLILKILEVF